MRRLRIPIITLGFALLATACTGTGDLDGTDATPTPTLTGEAAFIADLQAVGIDIPDPSAASTGRTTCNLIGMHLQGGFTPDATYDRLLVGTAETYGYTGTQAETVVGSAVRNLCPERSGVLPG